MTPAVEIQACRPEEVAELTGFIEAHWRADHPLAHDSELLHWQFQAERMGRGEWPGPTVLLARLGGKLVGMLGLIGFELNLKGASIPAVWLSQWYSLEEARSSGAGLGLLWAVRDRGFEAIFALGLNDTAARIYRAMRFRPLQELPRWVAVLDGEATLCLLAELDPSDLDRAIWIERHKFDGAGGPRPETPSAIEVCPWDRSSAVAWEELWRRELAVCCYGPSKAAADLQWRYVEHPTFRYELRVAVDSGSRLPLGLLVYRVEPILGRRERVVRVVEILGRPQAVQSLLTAAIDEARQHGALFLDVHSTHREIGEILERNGFRRAGSDGDWPGFPSRFQPFESGHVPIKGALWTSRRIELAYGPLVEAPELYLVKSDSDQDRPNVLDLEG